MLVEFNFDGFEKEALNCASPAPSARPFAIGKTFKNGREVEGAICLDALSGTAVCMLDGWRNRRPSYEKKKNVLSFRTGPPTTPPKSCCRVWGFGRPLKFTNQSLASSTSF